MDLAGKNLIAGSPSGESGNRFFAVNPKTSENLPPEFLEASVEEVDSAVELAEQAFRTYSQTPPEVRAGFLDRIAEAVENLGAPLIERAQLETALPEARLVGERARTCGQLRMFARLIREGSWVDARIDLADPARTPIPKPDLRRMRRPIGPVAVFGVSNFPLAFSAAGGDSASALAAGCSVVLKAHPAHPGTSEMVTQALLSAAEDSGIPSGVFSMVHGVSHEVGLRLVTHPLIQAVGFTGSLKAGRALFDAAARRSRPIPFYAEMGSINPVFLLPGYLDVRVESFVEGWLGSLTLGVGQFCTNPGLVVGIEGPGWETLLSLIAKRVTGMECGTMLHSGIHEACLHGIERLGETEGVRKIAVADRTPDPEKTEVAPAVFETEAASFLEDSSLGEEVFGPVGLLVRCRNEGEMEAVAHKIHGSLTASLHGSVESLQAAGRLIELLERRVGRLLFNGFPTGVEVSSAMVHGGPYPATTDSRATSVGSAAIERFTRPVCYQNFPDTALPVELRNRNEQGIWRLVDDRLMRDDIEE